MRFLEWIKFILIFLCLGFLSYSYYNRSQIPKIIHYCWYGNSPLPQKAVDAIASWKKYAPEYEIKRWDETNSDLNSNQAVADYYKNKKYAHVSDYFRFKVLRDYGGIYLDIDHILTHKIDYLYGKRGAVVFEYNESLSASFVAFEANHPLMKQIVSDMDSNKITSLLAPELLTNYFFGYFKTLKKNGRLQMVNDVIVFPVNVLMIDFGGNENKARHDYLGSWTQKFKNGVYYNIYTKEFIKQHALHLPNGRVFIPQGENVYYQLKNSKITGVLKGNIFRIYSEQENKYVCKNRICFKH